MNRRQNNWLMVVWCSLTGVIVASGCTSRPQEQTKRTFPMITVPVIYADPTARAEYLAMHYWDRFDFNDTAYVGSAALVSEQAIVDYITVLRYASYPVICDGLKHLMDKAEKYPAMYAYFSSQMEHYLFDAGSSLRNDEFYIPVLEHIVASDSLNEPRKIRPNLLLAQLRKNRPGTQAANIHYATASGIKASLHDLKSEYILVMFHNLNCGNCKELTAQIEASPVTGEMQKRKKLTILAVYPGQEVEAWRKHLAEMPSSWVNGYDYGMEIENQETYVLRIIPTLYLLDKNHRVIIKDAAFNYVEYYLNSILNLPATRDAKLPSK